MSQSNPWTADEIERLTTLWNHREPDGSQYSTSAISRKLAGGRTKCSVVGKAHRIGLPERPSPILRGGATPKEVKPIRPLQTLPPLSVPPPATQPALVPAPAPARHSQIVVYGRVLKCSWPIGSPGSPSFRFCDEPTDPAMPYCRTHCKQGYQHYVPRKLQATTGADPDNG